MSENSLMERVSEALERIRPALQADGGDVELVDVVDGIASVRMTGACHGCPMSRMTLQMGIEQAIRRFVPEIEAVEAVEID